MALPLCVGQIKRLIGSNQETLGILERLVAGSLAGAIAQSSIYPMEVRGSRVVLQARYMLLDLPAVTGMGWFSRPLLALKNSTVLV